MNSYIPDEVSRPGETIRDVPNETGWSIEEFANRMDVKIETALGLITGAIAVDSNIAINLARVLGASPDFWINRQSHYDAARPDGCISRRAMI